MKNLQNLEIINVSTKKGKLVALLSYQDISRIDIDLNNGYDTIEIPINIREIQKSVRDNMLVDQSVKSNRVKSNVCSICFGTGTYSYGGSFGGAILTQKCSCGIK